MNELSMEAPHVVLAALGHYTGTAHAVVAGVAGTTENLTVSRRPESPLDHALVAKLQWIKTTFGNALAASGRRAETALREGTHTVNVLSAADIAGGQEVDRSAESI
ncbi:hypothetical protein OG874_22450 [Nocardia sp. NBC_00565]|uniref:hypothetical protein n=1 Tax=Nocardia sp. NBC_00565 TaxID=2975993 RepID=UPI002E81C8B5|nr:hypothetical protein [Nocardia sp. NBC_00565]WUC07680.1 hypothetical protein OG874_22450 [Nocardia sp. NBC_00565]